jgi:hypothetical protein
MAIPRLTHQRGPVRLLRAVREGAPGFGDIDALDGPYETVEFGFMH